MMNSLLLLSLAAGFTGCRQKPRAGEPDRALSRKLMAQAAAPGINDSKSVELLRKAVAADPFNAAAHNNLGAEYLRLRNYYDAARELDEAIKLSPSAPQPRVNLGLVYETVNRLKVAAEQYEQALVVAPDYVPAVQALARVRVRTNQIDARTIELLRVVSLRATNPTWRQWAQQQLARLDAGEPPTTQETPAALETPPLQELLRDRIIIPAQ